MAKPELRIVDGTWEPKPTTGSYKNPEVVIEIFELDGDKEAFVTCACGACFEIEQIGVAEAMGYGDVQDIPEGIHYMEHYSNKIPTRDGTEYESGLRYTEDDE